MINRFLTLCLVVAVSASMNANVVAQVTFASFKQVKFFEGGTITDVADSAPLPSQSVKKTNDDNSYEVVAEASVLGTFDLRTMASVTLTASPVDLQNWQKMEAKALAQAALIDQPVVVGAPEAVSGIVQFHWAVTGHSDLIVKNAEDIDIGANQAFTTLSTKPTIPNTLMSESYTLPENVDNLNLSIPAAGRTAVFPVPWEPGTPFPVFFEMQSLAELNVTNNLRHTRKFEATIASDFGRTAILEGVLILDEAGEQVPGATLVSADGITYPSLIIPEPSSAVVLLLCVPLLRHTVGRRRSFF